MSFPVTWVLVADCGRCRLFELNAANGPLAELEDGINPEARLHEGDLVSDSAGVEGDARGQGQHSMGHEHTATEESNARFAASLADHLKQGLNEQRFARLVLVCPPEFLGILRDKLDRQVHRIIAEVIGLDLTQASTEEIANHLPPLSSLG